MWINDKKTLQGKAKIKLNYRLKEDEKITYMSPGELVFTTKNNLKFSIDWSNYTSHYEILEDGSILIVFHFYGLQNDFVDEQLSEIGLDEHIKNDRYDLSLFENIASGEMETLLIDINKEERNMDDYIETVSIEILDPADGHVFAIDFGGVEVA